MNDESSPTRPLRRRAYLAALAGATTGLAGCGGDETGTGTPTATDSATPSPTTTATETDSPTATEEPSVVTFDGGGASAFAAALDDLRGMDEGTLRIAAGTHRLDASEAPDYDYPLDAFRVHFDGTGLDDVTIAGPEGDESATLALGDPTRGFMLFADATGPTLRDFTVRHDPWPGMQGTIRDLAGDGTITLELDGGYPTFDEPPFAGERDPEVVAASVFSADGNRIRNVDGDERGNFKIVADAERVGSRRYRLTLADGVETGGLEVGRRLAVVARHSGAAGIAFRDCTEPTLERVTLRSASEYAVWFVAGDRPLVRDCVLAPGDGARLFSVNADGVHCDNCRRGPRVEGCRFERCGDDTVVADNELLVVDGFEDDRTVRIRSTFGSRVAGGDRLTAATPALERKGTLPAVAEVDQRGGGITTDPVNPESVTFAESVRGALSVGDLLTSSRIRNADTLVSGNVVRSIRARYVRIGGADGLTVENNEFVGTHSDGIEIEAVGGNAPGFPKGWSTDVTVRGNRIEATGLVGVPSGIPRGIHVGVDAGEAPDDAAVSGRPHTNVVVRDNEITDTAGPGIEVHDATGVTIRGNDIVAPGRIPTVERGRYGLGLWNVGDATVADTVVSVEADDVLGFGWRRGSESVTTSGNRYVVAGEERAATFDER